MNLSLVLNGESRVMEAVRTVADLVGALERRHRLIPDLEQHGAGDRVLVVLDFPLDEQLVLALEADLGEDTRPRRCGRNVDNIRRG